VIQEHIKKPLADEVLFGKLKGGGHVRVVLVKDEAAAEAAQEKDRLRVCRRAGDAKAGKAARHAQAAVRASRNRVDRGRFEGPGLTRSLVKV